MDFLVTKLRLSLTVPLDFHLNWHLRMLLRHPPLAHGGHSIVSHIERFSSKSSASVANFCPHPRIIDKTVKFVSRSQGALSGYVFDFCAGV